MAKVSVKDFFIPTNAVGPINEEDYARAEQLLLTVRAFSRTTYQSLYVIDYNRENFLYVSENPLFLCGESAEEMWRAGYYFYMKHVPEEEVEMLVEINQAGFDFFDKLPVAERKDYTISYDFHILHGKRRLLVNHKLTPMVLTSAGRIWLALCAVSLSSYSEPGHVVMRRAGVRTQWEYSLDSHRWSETQNIALTDDERQILLLSAQGYTVPKIGEMMCKGEDTIKFYKKRLFEKLGVANIVEAINFTTNHRLL